MFAKLTGKLDSFDDGVAIIDVNGVGYQVYVAEKSVQVSENEAVALYIETQVREDAINLFGFASLEERDWFRLLNSVQGVGGKVAMAILGTLSTADIVSAITLENDKAFTAVSGIGAKLASRITNELKGKKLPATFDVVGVKSSSAKTADNIGYSIKSEAISALVNLGYSRNDAVRAVSSACMDSDANQKIEDLIAKSLKEISKVGVL